MPERQDQTSPTSKIRTKLIPLICAVGLRPLSLLTLGLGIATFTSPILAHSQQMLFVAPTGSDSNPGTLSLPFRTIQKCATTAASGWTCEIQSGTYRETVTPNSGITITSYLGESVTIDGSDPVTGWTLYSGSVYKASIKMSAGDTNQVFVGHQMMTEARWPNGDDLFHVNWATAKTGTTSSLLVDASLPNKNWVGAKIHLWSGTDPFGHQTGIVTASSTGQLTINVGQTGTCPLICPVSGGHYYLFGVLAALDQQNEWFYDSSKGILYFWAPGNVNPNTLAVRAKQRPYAFDLSGKSNVTIKKLSIFASGIKSDSSSANNIIDGVNAQYLSHFTTLPPAPGDTSGYSILSVHQADTGIVLNGPGNILRNSTIAYSAGSGVVLLGDNSTVTNNLIHHVDYMGDYASGINVYVNGTSIQNNTIYSVGRQAIIVESASNLSGEDIGYNNLFDAMMLSRDGGEIYSCCQFWAGTRVHHNWIHDTQSLISGAGYNFAASGVYVDNATSGFEIDQNVLWNNQFKSIILNGAAAASANDNDVHNNSIPDINGQAYIWLNQIPNCGTTQVIENLALVAVNNKGNDPKCVVSDNNSTAPGANEMSASVKVGCNFTGCASSGPPAISGGKVAASIAVQPLSVTVAAGQKATFKVTAAGSPTLTFQWNRNGTVITGATLSTYTTPATTSADNGAVFTVKVSNSVGTVTSSRATLTVN